MIPYASVYGKYRKKECFSVNMTRSGNIRLISIHFSSHKHEVLKVNYWDQSMSGVCHQRFAINDKFSSIGQGPRTVLMKNCP